MLPGDIWGAVESIDETNGLFQVIRPAREVDRLQLRVGYATAGTGGLPALRARVEDAVEEAVGLRPEVDLVEREVLLRQGPPHKIPRVTKA